MIDTNLEDVPQAVILAIYEEFGILRRTSPTLAAVAKALRSAHAIDAAKLGQQEIEIQNLKEELNLFHDNNAKLMNTVMTVRDDPLRVQALAALLLTNNSISINGEHVNDGFIFSLHSPQDGMIARGQHWKSVVDAMRSLLNALLKRDDKVPHD